MRPILPSPRRRQAPARRALLLAAALALTPLWSGAEVWPSRPVKLIVPYAAGGGSDLIARLLATKLSMRLGQPVIVDNKGGAGGAIGFEAGVKAPADGYNFLFATTAYATNAATGRKLPYDPLKDMTPVGLIGTTALLVAVGKDSPAKTLRDLVEMARAKPNMVSYGSGGMGSMSHLGMEYLAAEAKVRFMHVPYKGMAPAFTDLMAGSVQAGMATFATATPLIEGGKLRVLAVTGSQRSPFAPNVPTAAEAGYPGVRIEFWWGLVAPARVPAATVKRMNEELNAILVQPEMRELLEREAAVPAPGSPEDCGKVIAADVARWTKLVKDANIRTE